MENEKACETYGPGCVALHVVVLRGAHHRLVRLALLFLALNSLNAEKSDKPQKTQGDLQSCQLIWLWVKTVLVDSILVGIGELTTHFRTDFSVGIESDVPWGYDLDFDFSTHGHLEVWKYSRVDPGSK